MRLRGQDRFDLRKKLEVQSFVTEALSNPGKLPNMEVVDNSLNISAYTVLKVNKSNLKCQKVSLSITIMFVIDNKQSVLV